MTIERFTKREFEQALPVDEKTGDPLWQYIGFEKGEHVYKMQIKNGSVKRVAILIRSSVKADGYAAETDQDSIRLWLVSKTNDSLGKKVDAYTKRTPGWQDRMQEKLRTLYARGLKMVNCPDCETGVLLKRNGKYGKFYGCSNFPACRYTANNLDKVKSKSEPKPKPASNLELLAEELNETEFEFEPSKYQKDIFDFVENGEGNAVVEAVAGSGKTTTIVHALQFTPHSDDVAFLAFNKKIAKELKGKSPSHVHVSTLHSLGYSNIRESFGNRIKVDNRKVYWIVKDFLEAEKDDRFKDVVQSNLHSVLRLVSLLKATLLNPTDDTLDYLCNRYSIEVNGDAEDIFKMVRIAFEKSNNETWRIDFDDMIYFSAVGKVTCKKYDWVFIDEAQDLNRAQIEFVLKSRNQNSRVIAIGDRKQSIYAFRGADTQAIPNIIDALDAKTLPLSITYRCPKSHVELAQQLVPQIEASENAIEGNIEHISELELINKLQIGDLVLCRVNAHLIPSALELIRNGIKAVVLGRDIGQGLIQLIEKIEQRSRISDSIFELETALEEYLHEQYGKLIKQGKEGRAAAIDDKVKTILALSENITSIFELKNRIKKIFTNESQGVVFSSVHRAKGGEAENVFILKPELMPHPLSFKSDNPEDHQQERNIKYVALTRSKSNLYFVH